MIKVGDFVIRTDRRAKGSVAKVIDTDTIAGHNYCCVRVVEGKKLFANRDNEWWWVDNCELYFSTREPDWRI